MTSARRDLGPVLWFFIAFKSAGIVLNLVFVALLALWVLPVVAGREGGGSWVPDLMTEGVLPVLEVAASSVGILLIYRRSRNMRKFWIVFLSVYCLVQLLEFVVGVGDEGVLLFLVTGLAWLAYWCMAKRPRELQLAAFWGTE